MARKPRIEYPGAVYHVMSRGDRQELIYKDSTDRTRFLECLTTVCHKTGWHIHAYVLMPNHYHLLLETPEANLVAGMKWIQGVYTNWHNRRHQQRGHVFMGRYKALIIDPESGNYFSAVSTYIHLNPVRAGLVKQENKRIDSFLWSSFPAYLCPAGKRPPYLRVNRVFAALGFRDNALGRRRYSSYVQDCAGAWDSESRRESMNEEWKEIRHGWCLGNEAFKQKMFEHIRGLLARHDRASYTGNALKSHDRNAAEELLSLGLREFRLEGTELPHMPKGDIRKQAIAWFVRKHTVVTNRWLARQLHMGHEIRISQAVRSTQECEGGDLAALRRQLERLAKAKAIGKADEGLF